MGRESNSNFQYYLLLHKLREKVEHNPKTPYTEYCEQVKRT
jgi:hypothetical protein